MEQYNWHLQPPNNTPTQAVERANNLLLEKYPDNLQIELATLTYSYIRREWWISFCKKEDTPEQPVLEMTYSDNSELSLVGIKWESEEWTWYEQLN